MPAPKNVLANFSSPSKRCISAIYGALFLIALFFVFGSKILAALTININNLPTSVTASEKFDVTVLLSGLESNVLYKVKSLGGSPGSDLYKLYTLGKDGSSWLAWNGAWDNMPETLSNASGSAQLIISSKFYNDFSGDAVYKIRIKKENSSTTNDSQEFNLRVNPTPSPSPSPTPTPTPTPSSTTEPSPTLSSTASPKPSSKSENKIEEESSFAKATEDEETDFTGEVLGATESSQSSFAETSEDKEENKKESKKHLILPFAIIGSGLLLLVAGSFPFLKNFIKNIRNKKKNYLS